jgi:DNA end-binding protein Ku
MPRSIWKGSLGFGLVNIPVALYPATTDKGIHFHQVEDGTSDRIRYKKVNERTGREVAPERVVKAMDMGGGEYVILSDEELQEAEPEKSRAIDIEGFVDLADIDPIFYRTAYYVAPQSESDAKAYHLLREAMQKADKIGVATFVMRDKEHLAAIRPDGEVLVLETLYFADEIRDPSAVLPGATGHPQVKPKEREMAQTLITSLSEKWNPADYHDSYREHVKALLKEKEAGHETIIHSEPEHGGKVTDLLAALQASLEGSGRSTARAASLNEKKKPAKKTAAKKAATKAAATKAAAKRVSRTPKRRGSGPSGGRRAS